MLWLLKAKLKNLVARDQISRFRPQRGEVLIDCGANIGGVTARLWRPGVEIHSFEPNPYAFAVLSRRLNRFSNVTCLNKAMLDHPGTVELFLHREAEGQEVQMSQASSLMASKQNVNPSNHVRVEAVDIVAYIERIPKPVGLLKMDVEGVEYHLLEALIESGIIHRIRYVLVEAHEEKMPEIAERAARVRDRIRELNLTNIDLGWH